jgi:uncharacterized protein YcbK (DUF882 family)
MVKNLMGPYFKREEFACKCGCGFDVVDVELWKVLQNVREYFGKPVSINSACRCHEHNEKVQKEANPKYVPNSSKSKHMEGIAADITVSGVSPDKVADYLEKIYRSQFGIGRYNTFTHIDVRPGKARWDYRS